VGLFFAGPDRERFVGAGTAASAGGSAMGSVWIIVNADGNPFGTAIGSVVSFVLLFVLGVFGCYLASKWLARGDRLASRTSSGVRSDLDDD
jgi:hypothetical protein